MNVGLVGLGRMGATMARRWRRNGHTVVGYARLVATVETMVADGAIDAGGDSLGALVAQLPAPRVLWLMANRVLSAMRWGFGGHVELRKGEG